MSTPAALGPAAEADGVAFGRGTRITMLPARREATAECPPWIPGTRHSPAGRGNSATPAAKRVVSEALLRGCGVRSLHQAPRGRRRVPRRSCPGALAWFDPQHEELLAKHSPQGRSAKV